MSTDVQWPQHAREAVEKLNSSIPNEWKLPASLLEQYPLGSDIRPLARQSGLFSELELAITGPNFDATSVLEYIKDRKITSAEVVVAFAKRAAIAQQTLECLADWFLDEALERAEELDQHYAKTGELVGPLHGLPISIKSQYHVKGRPASAGFSNYVISDTTSLSLEILKDAGAIFYCKTNLPQAIMALESQSFWGLTRNPLNTSLSPGGSSGGCSALMGAGGSPMSMGSDVGGSLRQPAAAVGLWTLKATSNRVPRARMYAINAGYDTIVATAAPQCKSLRDVDLWHSVILAAQPWLRDHVLLPMPWRMSSEPIWRGSEGRLRVGFLENDGIVMPHPPILRGIRALKASLGRDSRFEVVDYEQCDLSETAKLLFSLYFFDGGNRVRDTAKDAQDPLLPLTKFAVKSAGIEDSTVHEVWKLNVKRETFRAKYLEHWNKYNLDVLICPVAPQTAPQMETSKYWLYTGLWNLVDYPAAAFPTGLTVSLGNDGKVTSQSPLGQDDAYVQGLWDPAKYANTPVCLQAVGRRYEDETVMQALKVISEHLPLQD